MKTNIKRLLVALSAVLMSLISYYFINGWYNVVPWLIAALMVGYTSKNRRDSIINGAMFGYLLFLAYILLGYTGNTDTNSMIKFLLFDVVFSLVGSIACVIGAFIGNWMERRLNREV